MQGASRFVTRVLFPLHILILAVCNTNLAETPTQDTLEHALPTTRECPTEYKGPTKEDVRRQFARWFDHRTQTSYCEMLSHVCIDQDRLVVYKPEHLPILGGKVPWYSLYKGVAHDFQGVSDALHQQALLPDPMIRPRTTREQTHDLAHPEFSNCTVPVIFYLSYMFNVHEIFEKMFVPLWVATQRDAWDPRYSIIFQSLGQSLPSNLKLLSSFHTHQPPVTLSEASARLSNNLSAKFTIEGRHHRCFQTLGLCRFEQHWHWTTSWWDLRDGWEQPNWKAAKAFVDLYERRGMLPKIGPSLPKPINSAELELKSGKGQHGKNKGWGSSPSLLRVVLARRPGSPRRSILNSEEVIRWCNAWRPSKENVKVAGVKGNGGDKGALKGGQNAMSAYRSGLRAKNSTWLSQWWWGQNLWSPASRGGAESQVLLHRNGTEGGPSSTDSSGRSRESRWEGLKGTYIGAQCVAYDFEDLLLSASLMQQTDVLIGVHGAAMVNAIFMSRGASAIEIRPLGFVGFWPNHYLRRMLTITDQNQSVFWYGINVVNGSNSAPGKQEVDGVGADYLWKRDRHVRVETSILQRLFDEIAGVRGDPRAYARVAATSRHYLNDDGTTPEE
ncbi:hypothetical protein CEUSTIGMA_g337.t1 [Chlamydomonas eustigma]|uniref:Glycosyltransferase n=1 Tax=Chlamydomonas eustigma TaxID=1157962 RepID=A0A250WQD7_9CHLO|nr:hypothetical protein CEUSTIGMA_g337.t1 [Chlamydomonas eustigma]|eukprot:GAX72882.1 hypothetical protein CEUSTIGMA_g337.t1 [Chlamydomonas eustigma]